MKCPDCDKELIKLETAEEAVCPKCQRIYDEEELKNIIDAEMIEEDMNIWRKAKRYK